MTNCGRLAEHDRRSLADFIRILLENYVDEKSKSSKTKR
jgi:hypothetical protein